MKQLIYISGVTGGIFLILRIVGIYVDFAYNDQLLSYGAILVIVCLTLGSIYKYIQNQKIRNLLRSYKYSNSQEPVQKEAQKTGKGQESERNKQEKEDGNNDDKKTKSGSKGLEPGKNSLRERKTGLVWGGGNIKGANATRGTKRKFIKRW